MEILDQKIKETKHLSKAKRVNGWLSLFVPFMVVYTIFSVFWTKSHLDSPFLPAYVSISLNSLLINFTGIQVFGVLPSLYFRIKKQYLISSLLICAFVIAGFLLRANINLARFFY